MGCSVVARTDPVGPRIVCGERRSGAEVLDHGVLVLGGRAGQWYRRLAQGAVRALRPDQSVSVAARTAMRRASGAMETSPMSQATPSNHFVAAPKPYQSHLSVFGTLALPPCSGARRSCRYGTIARGLPPHTRQCVAVDYFIPTSIGAEVLSSASWSASRRMADRMPWPYASSLSASRCSWAWARWVRA